MKKRILITGGCGFMGRHFVNRLCEEDVELVVIDNLTSGMRYEEWPDILKTQHIAEKTSFIYKDVCDEIRFHKDKYDVVIHLAANVGGRETISNNFVINSCSLEIDSIFFRWVVENRPFQTIYMSSSAIYPVNKQMKSIINLKEDLIDFCDFSLPDSIYGWSKLTGEYLAYLYSKKYNLNIFCPRPFSGYGEDQSGEYPIPAICKRLLNKENPIVIWGSGEQQRDFVYVDDVIDAILSYLPNVTNGYDTLNIGNGYGCSFKQVVDVGSSIVGYSPIVDTLKDKPEGVKYRVSDNSKMLKYYIPKVSFEGGLKRCLK